MITINVNEDIILEFEVKNLEKIKRVFLSVDLDKENGYIFDGTVNYKEKIINIPIPILEGLVDTGYKFISYLEIHTVDNKFFRICENEFQFTKGIEIVDIEIVDKKKNMIEVNLKEISKRVQLNKNNLELRPVSITPQE